MKKYKSEVERGEILLDIPIEIETQDKFLVYELFNVKKSAQGMQTELSAGAVLRYDSTFIRKAYGVPDIISLPLQLGRDVAVGILSAWLYDKLKGRASKLKIGERQVSLDKKEIQLALQVAVGAKIGASAQVSAGAPPQEKKFVRDIELAKLQAKITNEQAKYYMLMGALFSATVAFEILVMSVGLSHFQYMAQDGIMVFLILVAGLLYWRLRTQKKQFRKYFEDIYNEKKIEY